MFAAGSEGGVRHGCNEQCGEAAFLYIPHSAVVSRSETALPLWTREKGGDVSDPPKNRGVMRPFVAVACGIPLLGPMGSLTSSFIPAGRLVKTPLSPRASSWRIGPRRQGFASPLRALDGSGPIRRGTLFTRVETRLVDSQTALFRSSHRD